MRPNDVSNAANLPMTHWELGQYYNLEAVREWKEDGYIYRYDRLPSHPLRIEIESRIFWDQVDPNRCYCGAQISQGREECLECYLSLFGTAWQEEQYDRMHGGAYA